jgi:thiosulfate dehydrogenase [quinone] large subunit
MIDAGWINWIDNTVKISLMLIGLSLILGLFTRAGCWGALFFLTLFYLLAIPTAGAPQPGNEGTYLIVNKTLIEGAAVAVLLFFNTGAIAGLDMLMARWKGARRIRSRVATIDSGPSLQEGGALIPPSRSDDWG